MGVGKLSFEGAEDALMFGQDAGLLRPIPTRSFTMI
jgi:hypothetical protein